MSGVPQRATRLPVGSTAPAPDADAALWRACGAHPDDHAALAHYARSAFGEVPRVSLPLVDEPCVGIWRMYADEAARDGAAQVLRRHLPQLRFAIAESTAADGRYIDATRRGIWSVTDVDDWPGFVDPAGLSLTLTPTAAGHLPTIVARHRIDYERLVQALTRRSSPAPIPASSGACMVAGAVNWERVHHARQRWAAARGGDSAAAWAAEFAALRATPAAWQDRFMILSTGPYAAVPAAALDMDDETWCACSVVLRREHEAAHYLTKRVLGTMQNTLHDELLADFAGIVGACGRYRADWARRILGVDEAHVLRDDARLRNYRGTPALNDRAMRALAAVARRAIAQLERFHLRCRLADNGSTTLESSAAALLAIAGTPLCALAGPGGASLLERTHDALRRTVFVAPEHRA